MGIVYLQINQCPARPDLLAVWDWVAAFWACWADGALEVVAALEAEV